MITFSNRTNPSIDKLVEISWKASGRHEKETLLTRFQRDSDLYSSINDESDDPSLIEGSASIAIQQASDSISFDSVNRTSAHKIIIAVDTGIAHLGEFVGGGIGFAIRGAGYCIIGNDIIVLRYNTGPLLIDRDNLIPIFHYIGGRLGNRELYLRRLSSGEFVDREGVLGNTNQLQDRCRNFVERMIHEEVIGILIANKRGLLLIDGALSGGTFDTPVRYLEQMLEMTVKSQVDVAAISKKTRITVGGQPLSSLFDNQHTFVGYLPLMKQLEREREQLVEDRLARPIEDVTLGNQLFAARFGLGPPALTFRVDVKNSYSSTVDEVINSVYSDCQIYGCYPKPLIEAHRHSTFLHSDVQLLLADLVVRTGAQPKERQSMDWLFAPIGSFGK